MITVARAKSASSQTRARWLQERFDVVFPPSQFSQLEFCFAAAGFLMRGISDKSSLSGVDAGREGEREEKIKK